MKYLLDNPAVQAGGAPFVVGLIVMLALGRARLGGVAVTAAFATVVALVSGFSFNPLTATRKLVLLTLLASVLGIALDLTLKPGRLRSAMLALAAALATLWVFWPVLALKPPADAWLQGATAVLLTAWLVGYLDAGLASRPIACGAAILMLGVGAGVLAILGASALFGQYSIAIGAGAGAFLLVMMIANQTRAAGATLALPGAVAAGLIASGAMILAHSQWYAAALLALVPLAAGIPAAIRAPVWRRAISHALLAAVPVAAVGAAAYFGSRSDAG